MSSKAQAWTRLRKNLWGLNRPDVIFQPRVRLLTKALAGSDCLLAPNAFVSSTSTAGLIAPPLELSPRGVLVGARGITEHSLA